LISAKRDANVWILVFLSFLYWFHSSVFIFLKPWKTGHNSQDHPFYLSNSYCYQKIKSNMQYFHATFVTIKWAIVPQFYLPASRVSVSLLNCTQIFSLSSSDWLFYVFFELSCVMMIILCYFDGTNKVWFPIDEFDSYAIHCKVISEFD
jgi:hypothetical protein